jgi:glyoxylase-like metal-dependent hydrolase (beta-lactamase superfamily II)
VTEILPGITQLKIPIPHNPLGFTNVYLLRSGDEHVLIDAGFGSPEALQALRSQMATAGADVRRIARILITHAHGDHIGLAAQVKELSGATIALHHLERRPVAAAHDAAGFVRLNADWHQATGMPADPPPGAPPPARHRHGPHPGRPFPQPADPDMLLEDGQEIHADGLDLRIIWTPGHSPGHVCLYESNRKVLFSADHVLPSTTPNIGLRPGSDGQSDSSPLDDYLRSLAKVRDLDVKVVLPGHETVFCDLPGRVDQIIAHHKHRNDEIMAAMVTGPKTAYQVAELITWMPTSGGVKFHNLAHWDQRMAVSETISHVQSLRGAGAIERYGRDGVVYYQLTSNS